MENDEFLKRLDHNRVHKNQIHYAFMSMNFPQNRSN